MVGQLDHFHQATVGAGASDDQAGCGQLVAVVVVHFVAVTMALGNLQRAICCCSLGAFNDHAGIGAQTHGAALVIDVFLIGHDVNYLMGGVFVELGGSGSFKAGNVAGELAHGGLQAQANAQEGYLVLAGVLGSQDLALEGALAKAARHQDAIHATQHFVNVFAGHAFAIHQLGIHGVVAMHAGVMQSLNDGKVSVGQAGVLAHDANLHGAGAGVHGGEEALQGLQVAALDAQAHASQHLGFEFLIVQLDGHLVDAGAVFAGQHVFAGDVAEGGNLLAHLGVYLVVAAAHNEVGLHAQAAQLLHGVLRGLGFDFMSCSNVGNQRAVHKHYVAGELLVFELAGGLDERLRLNVAHGAANFGDDEVGARAFGNAVQLGLDGVGYMGNYLNGAAQKVAVALAGKQLLVDGALGEVGFAQQVLVDEALVMSQVKVAFVAVFGNEYLAVLEGAHGAGVNVQIRIHLLHHD